MKPVDYSSGDDCDDEISVGCPSPQNQLPVGCSDDDDIQTVVTSSSTSQPEDKHAMTTPSLSDSSHHSKTSGVRSFSILDILNHRPVKVAASASPVSAPESKLRRIERSCDDSGGCEDDDDDESKDPKLIVRPWDNYAHLNIPPHFSMAAAAAAAAAAGFLNPVHRYPFTSPSTFGHPAATSSAAFHPYHRSPAFGTGINLNVGLHHHLSPSSSNRASSASPYSGSSVQGDTDMEADDVSTGGSASASPLMASSRQKALLTSGSTSTPMKRSAESASTPVKSAAGGSSGPAGAATAPNGTPLDALFQMTSKTFEGVNGSADSSGNGSGHSQLFSPRQQAKKKRKSRTAFTNHQIFELEKRFLYQKYLSPADRDEIALSLGLTNAQVITWFQNRRAKLKRDMEELKKDVESAKLLGTAAAAAAAAHHHHQQHPQHPQPPHHHHHHHHKGFVGTMAEMSLLQKKADEYHKTISANE